MNSKERVLIALNHEEPDRVPINVTFVPELVNILKEKYKEAGDIGVYLGNDAVTSAGGFELSYYQDAEKYVCRYGVEWETVRNQSGLYTEMVGNPLAGDKSKLQSWQLPDYNEESQYDDFKRKVDKYGKEKWMVATLTCTIFETSWALRGLDQLMVDMLTDEDYVNELFDKVMEFPLQAGLKNIDIGADMIWIGDDVAMQSGMMISPAMFRKFLKPRFDKIVSAFKERNKDIKVMYHSCGNPADILDDLVDVQIDVLNSLQPKAVDLKYLKDRYAKKLALWGGMDIQEIMPMGTPEQVDAEVKRLVKLLGRSGGYVLAPAHHIQADTSINNVNAFYDAAGKYGQYK